MGESGSAFVSLNPSPPAVLPNGFRSGRALALLYEAVYEPGWTERHREFVTRLRWWWTEDVGGIGEGAL